MNKARNFIQIIPKPFKNKYIITLIIFGFWISFIDDYNLIKQYQIKKNIKDIKTQKLYYLNKIKSDSSRLHDLKNNKKEQEKFAREKFLMKKENEDIFIIRKKTNE